MEQIIAFIARVGEWVSPLVLIALGLYFSVKEIKDFFTSRKNHRHTTTAINLLTQVAQNGNSETKNSEKIEELETELIKTKQLLQAESSSLKAQSSILGEMLSLIFENSTLAPEVKERLRVLKTKLDCPSDSLLIEELQNQNILLKDELTHVEHKIDELKNSASVKIVKDIEADTISKKTINPTIIQ